jgi:inner membrane protein
MQTITHALIGLTIYCGLDKKGASTGRKKSLFFLTVGGSTIPDIDTVTQWFDHQGMYQMWHRGITHSLFFIPVWAALLVGVCFLLWKTKDWRLWLIAFVSVGLHVLVDLSNSWGTGILEPFSQGRYSIGTLPYQDVVINVLMLIGFVTLPWIKSNASYRVFRTIWLLMALYTAAQYVQGAVVFASAGDRFDSKLIAAQTLPGTFRIVGKTGNVVEVLEASAWTKSKQLYRFESDDRADLRLLFERNPAAKVLYDWSPIIVVVNNEGEIGVFDPRFYRNGHSFLHQSISK